MPTLLIALLESGAAAAAPLQRWAEWVGEGEVGGWERRRDRKGSCRRGRGAQGQGEGSSSESSVCGLCVHGRVALHVSGMYE